MQTLAPFPGFGGHIVQAFAPAADRFAGGIATDVVSLKKYRRIGLLIVTGAIEDAGISNLVTALACDDTVPTTTVAMGFRHRSLRWSTTNDTWLAQQVATSAGYNFTLNHAVANAMHWAEVTAEEVEQAAPGFEYVQFNIAETANKTITASVLLFGLEPRYPQDIPQSMIS